MSRFPIEPIFFDPKRRRWGRVKVIFLIILVPTVLLLGMVALAVLANPILPMLGLPSAPVTSGGGVARPEALPPPPVTASILTPRLRALEERQRQQAAALRRKYSKIPSAVTLAKPATRAALRAAFLVNWDERSLESLQDNHEALDVVFPEWLHLTGTASVLSEDQPARRELALTFLASQNPRLGVMPLVNNFTGSAWEGEALAANLANPDVRVRLIADLSAFISRVRGVGLCLDFEDMPALPKSEAKFEAKLKGKNKIRVPPYESYLLFLRELGAALHADGRQLAVCAPFVNPVYPYRQVAALCDLVVVKAIDQHWSGGEAGPLAGQSWYDESLARCASVVPAEKLMVAFGNYAYDWTGSSSAKLLSCEDALRHARTVGCAWQWDPASLNPFFGYRDGQNLSHQVWVLDATTAFNQLSAAQTKKTCGFALWRLGSEDPGLWRIWTRDMVFDNDRAQTLAKVNSSDRLEFLGAGEAMRVTAVPTDGVRDVIFDPVRSLITSEHYKTYPSPYVLTRYGAGSRTIVLTFDDGPDPDYTPAILDCLKREGVPAVFFIVGNRGERHPELIDRIFKEGHELGNHTFTHPNMLLISLRQIEVELSATQRLIEARTGRQTLLFRPPYGIDSEPHSLREIQTVEAVNQLGYLSVGMQLDPQDWSKPGADEIVRRVVEQAERNDGNIVLLHDAGGDRTQTVAALPTLIAHLRERGFTFVSLSTQLGTTRDQLMPRSTSGWISPWLGWAGFTLITLAQRLLETLFMLGVVLGVARLMIIGVLAVCEQRRKARRTYDASYLPSAAVIVPAYNEEKVVVQTVRSLLTADYRGALEIVVVDDGSKDATYALARDAFANEPRVRVLSKTNGGKSAALNYGIAHCRADIVIGLDADTVFKPDTVAKLVRHFVDPKVAAVAGNAKVGNRINLLTRWQALEYITCQNLDRRAFAFLNCITVVPGAIGAWRRVVVENANGFSHLTLAEDADLTITLRRKGYRVINEDEAIALTEAPDSLRDFIKQRFRWMFGTIQAAVHHRGALFNPRAGALGWVALPNILIFQVFFPLVSPVMDLMLVLSVGSWALDSWYHPGQTSSSASGVLFYYLLFVAVDFFAAWLAFRLEPAEDKRLLVWLFFQRFCYRQLMYYVAIKATIAALRGEAVGWGSLKRKATVPT